MHQICVLMHHHSVCSYNSCIRFGIKTWVDSVIIASFNSYYFFHHLPDGQNPANPVTWFILGTGRDFLSLTMAKVTMQNFWKTIEWMENVTSFSWTQGFFFPIHAWKRQIIYRSLNLNMLNFKITLKIDICPGYLFSFYPPWNKPIRWKQLKPQGWPLRSTTTDLISPVTCTSMWEFLPLRNLTLQYLILAWGKNIHAKESRHSSIPNLDIK